MDTTNTINDEIKETSRVRFSIDRHHSNLSLGGFSYASSNFEGDDEETQHSIDVCKSSRPGIPHSLAWSMSSETNEEASWTREDTQEVDDDVRQDDRQRLMTEDSNGRERLLSTTDDGIDYSRDTTTSHQVSSHQCEELVLERPAPIASCFRVKSCPIVSRLDASSPAQITTCFRATSCPEMPNLDCESRSDCIDSSERVDLAIRRTRAFTEEPFDYQNSMRTQKKVRLFNRSDSMLIDSTYGSADFSLRQESPTAVWVYWEENLECQSPISSVTQPQHS